MNRDKTERRQGDADTAVEATPPASRENPARRPGGRSARVSASVLRAAFEILTEKGIDAFTIREVASRAEVHETSIYRRWGTPAALGLDACLHFAGAQLAIPDTGSLRSDLKVFLDKLVVLLCSPQGAALLALSASRHPDAIAARRSFMKQRFENARIIFDRAVARGEFPHQADPMLCLEALVAPLYLRLLVTGQPLRDWPIEEMIDRLLGAYPAKGAATQTIVPSKSG